MTDYALIPRGNLRNTIFTLILLSALCVAAMQPAQAQTFSVIHTFTAGADGSAPIASVTIGGAGLLYGTASSGGTGGDGLSGVAFKMNQRGSGWILTPLHEFAGGIDGSGPVAGVTIGPNGALYGTTAGGGSGFSGTVYELTPSQTVCKSALCYWEESVLFAFTAGPDGQYPYGNVYIDSTGAIYGTASFYGGSALCGVVWKLTESGGAWTEAIPWTFTGHMDGCDPGSSVIFDPAGNLYTTASGGGIQNSGAVIQLTPANGGWSETSLIDFLDTQEGNDPASPLIMDQSGNIYGTLGGGGSFGSGGVYELTYGSWNFSLLYNFPGGCNSSSGVTMDAVGNLYGVCPSGGVNGFGWVFELSLSNGMWVVSHVHDFDKDDGATPRGTVVFDTSGNLYGTAEAGGIVGGACGEDGCGTIWEIQGLVPRGQ